jgi:uncharacterized protein (DUF2147 family)
VHRCCLAVTLVTAVTMPALAAEPVGDWLVSERTAVIRIEPCDTALCGTVVWVKPGVAEQDPKPAARNADPAKKGGPTGIQILLGMKPVREGRWKGEIYNPRDGNTYTGQITLTSADVLNVEGCVLGGFICSGEEWTRTKCEEAPPARTTVGSKAATTGSSKPTRKPDKAEKAEKAEKVVISCAVAAP